MEIALDSGMVSYGFVQAVLDEYHLNEYYIRFMFDVEFDKNKIKLHQIFGS